MSRDYIINAHDLWTATGFPMICEDRSSGFQWKIAWMDGGDRKAAILGRHPNKDEDRQWGSFEECTAYAKRRWGYTGWVTAVGEFTSGYWFPAEIVQKTKDLGLQRMNRNDKLVPVKYSEPGHPCTEVTGGRERGFSGHLCARVAVTSVEANGFGSRDGFMWRCAMHVASQKRSDDSMAAHRARWEEADRKHDEAKTNHRAAVDWAERLATEFNIECAAADNGKVEVVANPEKLYARLVEIQAALREIGMEELMTQGQFG